MPKLKFKLPAIESENLSLLCGPVNTNLNQIEQSLEVKIKSRGNSFSISGEKNNVIKSRLIIEDLAKGAKSRDSVSADEVHFSIRRALNGATKDNNGQIFELKKEKDLTIQTPKLYVSPRNKSQVEFLSSIYEKDIAFGIGPAGTGKTYLAVAAAVNQFMEDKVNKIILTRPAVEAGGSTSGLSDAIKVLEKEKGISFFYFHPEDVVRHGLVQKIIEAYEKNSW